VLLEKQERKDYYNEAKPKKSEIWIQEHYRRLEATAGNRLFSWLCALEFVIQNASPEKEWNV